MKKIFTLSLLAFLFFLFFITTEAFSLTRYVDINNGKDDPKWVKTQLRRPLFC